VSVDWSGTKTGDCNICHADDSGTGAGVTEWSAAHTDHLRGSYSANTNIDCNACHADTALGNSSINGKGGMSNHPDAQRDVVFNSFADPASTAGWNGTNCNNTYCHSDGKSATNPTHANQAWSGNFTACNECHGTANNGTGGAPDGAGSSTLSQAHADHTNTTTNYDCDDCHNRVYNPSNIINDYTLHVNKTNDVDSALSFSGGKCSSTDCHGTNSDAWSSDLSSYDNCTICHGIMTTDGDGAAAAYLRAPGVDDSGKDTEGHTVDSDEQVGAHQAHLQASHGISNSIGCGECHIEHTGVNDVGHIDNALPADIKFNGPMGTFNAANADYNDSNNQCSNVYCHDGSRFEKALTVPAWANGMDTAPTWSNTDYLADTLTSTDCGMCHGWPPADSHDDSTNCSQCHPNVDESDVSFTTVANIIQHVDRTVQVAGCTGCHMATIDTVTTVNMLPADDANRAKHNTTHWTSKGHGQSTGNLPLACEDCHTSHYTADNIYALKYVTAGSPVTDLNNNCLECHKEGSSNPKVSTIVVNSIHNGLDHTATLNGGRFCFDCHDPHGDGNIEMVQNSVASSAHPVYGYPTNAVDVTFTAKASASDYADDASPFEGVCQVCHSATSYYKGSGAETHYADPGNACVNCHSHNGKSSDQLAFEGAGDCDSCHGYPPMSGDGKNQAGTQYDGGKGAHNTVANSHVNTTVLDPATDQYGDTGTGYKECVKCHRDEASHDGSITHDIAVEYSFDGVTNASYQGVRGDTTTPKTCFNVLCHFTKTPRWSAGTDE
jgi:predicted CxxxxCH...CXXCH cytochrome family protein